MRNEKRRSTISRQSVQGSQLQNQWLVVFPYELEFTAPFDSSTVFYFQKNYQVFGDLKKSFPPCAAPAKYRFNDMEQAISFRLFSLNNLTYKWSMYRVYETGQEEYIEEFQLDVKSQMADKVVASPTPQGSFIMGQDRSIVTGWVIKDLQGNFQNSGVKLKYMLYVFDDMKQIEDQVRQFIARNQQSTARGEAAKSQLEVTVSNGNVDISSQIDKPSNENIEANIMNTPQQTEQAPIPEANQPAPETNFEPSPQQIQLQQETPVQDPEPQAKEEAKSPSMLKLESRPIDTRIQEPSNQNAPELDVVAEQPEKASLYTPEDIPEQKDEPQQQEALPVEGEPQAPVSSQPPLQMVKPFAANFDLKKVIIIILLVIIGMLAVVVIQGQKGKQKEKESKLGPKKKKSSKRK